MSLQEWECLAIKKVGDDVSGTFASNASAMPDIDRFGGFAQFSDNMNLYTGDQAKFDANWVPTDTAKIRGNPSTNVIDFTTLLNIQFDVVCNFDLWSHGIFPSDSNWTLRAKWDLTTVTNPGGAGGVNLNLHFGLSDLGLRSKIDTQDFIVVRASLANGTNLWRGYSGENIQMALGPVFTFAHDVQVETLFIELKRTGVTTFEMTFYSDSNYSIPIEKGKGVINGNPINLRFITIVFENQGGVSGRVLDGTLDDIQFFNDTEGLVNYSNVSNLGRSLLLHGDEDLEPAIPNIIFTDDFSYGSQSVANTAWPSSDVARLDPFPDELTWKIFIGGGTQETITHDLGFTLPDDSWRLRFKLRTDVITVPNLSTVRHIIGISSVNGGDANTSQDFIGLHSFVGSSDTQYGTIFSNDGGIGSLVAFVTEAPAVNTRFIEIIRDDLLNFTVNIYSDSGYSTLLDTQSSAIIGINDLTGLRYLKMYTTFQGTNTYEGAIDDIELLSGSLGLIFNEDFSTYGAPVTTDFTEDFDTATGWTTTDSTRVRIEEDQGFLFHMAVADASNDAIAFDLGAVVNPLGNVIFTENFSFANQALADASWPSTDLLLLDPFPNELAWNIPAGTAEETISHDLGVNLNGNFRLRTKIDLQTRTSNNSIAVVLWWYISDNQFGLRTVAQDHLGMFYTTDQDPGDQVIRIAWGENQIVGVNDANIRNTVTVPETQFVEILRTTPTSFTVNIYSDSGYTVLTDTLTQAIPSGITGLRYLHLSMSKTGGTNQLQGILDDIEVVDNSETVSDTAWVLRYKQSVTNIVFGDVVPNKTSIFGLWDSDQTANAQTTQGGISSWFLIDGLPRSTWGFMETELTGTSPATTSFDFTFFQNPISFFDVGVFYVEIARLSDTEYTGKWYNDANFTDLRMSGVGTIPAGSIKNLRFLKVMNEIANGTGQLDVTYENIQFWNGRSASCDPVAPTTSFFEDFSTYTTQPEADTAWAPQVTFPTFGYAQVDIVADNLRWQMRRDGTDNRITFDLGFAKSQ